MHIQVFKTYKESFSHVFHHKLPWFRAAFAPLVLYVISMFVTVLFYLAAGPVSDVETLLNEQTPESVQAIIFLGLANIVPYFISFIAMTSVMIKGYRYGVLEEGGHQWWDLQFKPRFIKLVAYNLLIIALTVLYLLISAGIVFVAHYFIDSIALDIILGIILGLYALYLYSRLGLTYLLVSIDAHDEPLTTSWHLLKRNVWRFIALLFLAGITIAIIGVAGVAFIWLLGIALAFITEFSIIPIAVIAVLFIAALWLLYWAVFAKAFSLVYLSLNKK